MLSNLGIIVALYVIFRILDILIQGPKRYPYQGGYVVMFVLGVIALVLIGLGLVDFVLVGSRQTTLPTQ